MKQLLNLCIKKSEALKDIMPEPGLLYGPFDKAISRLQYQPDLFNFALRSEKISELASIPSISWEECCRERALELLALDFEHYWFSYSGGIDSTGMMAAILKYWPAAEQQRISIVLSHHSIEENPWFFERYIANFKIINFLRPISSLLLKMNALLVTGELGDQLFGSDILSYACRAYGDEVLQKKFLDNAPEVIEVFTRTPGSGKRIFEHFLPIVEEAPFPIRTNQDFFWWLNFTQKWQHVKFRFLESKEWNLNATYGKNILHFFDSPSFQKWSLDNHDLKIKDSWKSYKCTAKEFIADFTKNPEQNDLIKRPSLQKTYFLTEKRIAVNSEGQPIKSITELVEYVRRK